MGRRPRRPPRTSFAGVAEEYAPIAPEELRLFTWHPGRQLRGTLVDVKRASIGVCGGLRCGTSTFAFTAGFLLAEHVLASGADVSVLDPCVSVGADGVCAIGISNACDIVVHGPPPAPTDDLALLAAEKAEGNARFTENKSVAARSWPRDVHG